MKFADYEIIERCGAGAYGEVFLAKSRAGKLVALKLIGKSKQIAREFAGLRNYTRINDFRHLIQIFHVGETENQLYYTMEIADNLGSATEYIPATLDNVLAQKGRFTPAETIEIGKKILSGIAVLHQAGLIHRDIKPENILLVNGEIKLSDIGLLRAVSQTMTLGGTLGFIPPEKITSSSPSTSYERTKTDDLYAVGKVLYCCLTGNQVDDFPAFPGSLANREYRKLNLVLLTACARDPRLRFKNAEEFEQALQDGLAAQKRLFSLVIRSRYYLAGVLLAAGVFLLARVLPSATDTPSGNPIKDPQAPVAKSFEPTEEKIDELEIAKRVSFDFEVSDGSEGQSTGSFLDPIYQKYSPLTLEGQPRQMELVLADSFDNWGNWDSENSDGFSIYQQKLFIGNQGTIYLKTPILTPYAIRLELDDTELAGKLSFRLAALNAQKQEKAFYQCTLVSSDDNHLTLLPLEYQPPNGHPITFKPGAQPAARSGIHLIELVQTEHFFRFYMDNKLLLHAPSFFAKGYLGIKADRNSLRNTAFIRNLKVLKIETKPDCPAEKRYSLPNS